MSVESSHNDKFPLEIFFSALNAADEAIAILDLSAKFVWVNQSFETLTLYKYSDLIGKDISILNSNRQDDEFYSDLWS
ncbi:MAG: PAS domain-containing protein, partial [Kangiellaceae bacterium]|nr:PAS domain-containing protein [Kangiellaceae bacterium]